MLKTRLNVGSVATGTSVGGALRDIVAAEGLGGLYAGAVCRCAQLAVAVPYVAVCLDRTVALAVAVLGILQAGAAYGTQFGLKRARD